MASREFLEEMWAEAKKLLPGWMYASLYQAARPRSGGKARANRAKEKKKEQEALAQLQKDDTSKALISFVVSELSSIEKARKTPLVGSTGQLFKEIYLDPLGIDRDDVHITIDKDEIEDINPRLVIALGRVAKENLGDWADYMLPHPEAIRKHGDSGEVGRKLKSIHRVLFDKYSKNEYFKNRHRRAKIEPIVEYKSDLTSVDSQIIKAAAVKRIVYGVVSDPYGVKGAEEDAHNDWISPDTIEHMAHDYLKESRVVGLQHKERSTSKIVESWIEQYPSREEYLKAINGEPHRVTRRQFGDDKVHSGSWIAGVELNEKEWGLYQKGEINGFSIGARGVRQALKKSEMPQVTFVDLIESTENA